MSYDPASDPRYARPNQYREQQAADEQYLRDLANQPRMYNTPLPPQPAISTPVYTEVNTRQSIAPRDRVRWGPILAGLVSALATLLVLSLLGVAVGLTAASGDPNGGATAAANKASNYGTGAAIWAAISALIAFFIGGYVAARTAAVRGKGNGWVNGALVWAVTLPLLLWLATSGASGFLNAIGFNLNGFINNVTTTANGISNNNVNPGTVQNTTEAARNGAWGALGALVLGLIASGLGGLLGSRSYDDGYDQNDGIVR